MRWPSRKLHHQFRVYDFNCYVTTSAVCALALVYPQVVRTSACLSLGRPDQQSGSAKRNRPGNNQHSSQIQIVIRGGVSCRNAQEERISSEKQDFTSSSPRL